VVCDERLFHRPAAATGNALSPTVDRADRRLHRTSRDVDDAAHSRCLASVSAGRHWHQTVLTFVLAVAVGLVLVTAAAE